MIGMSVPDDVARCVLFSSHRIIGVENGGGETYIERGCLVATKIK